MRSLIIGGSGFVGAYLIRHLRELGQEVAVTKMPGERLAWTDSDRIQVLDLDILDERAVLQTMASVQPDVVYHLAAQSSVAISWERPQLTADVNIRGCISVLEAVRAQKKTIRVLLVGSGEEYGKILPRELPVREDHPVRPESIYAVTKACQNMTGVVYARAYGMQVVMVRAFNHIGPGQSPVFVVSDFCRQTAQIEAGGKDAVIRTGNLEVKRDFTDVRDVVRAYELLAHRGRAGETYNVGSGRAVSIGDILKMIIHQSKLPVRVEPDPEKFRPLDIPVVEADISRLRKDTGWEPKIRLQQTIQETLDAWRQMIRVGGFAP